MTFKGGIHPLHAAHEGKHATREKAIREFIAQTVCIPMDMHLGAPSVPVVKKGDMVDLGQVIGEPANARGIPVHASVSGEVIDVGRKQLLGKQPSLCVTIRNDFADRWVALSGGANVEEKDASTIVNIIRAAGICGLGGACFPTHVKLTIPEGKHIDTIILNGAECETFLTADDRLMRETPGRVVDGLRAVMRALGVQRGLIAVESNKPEALAATQQAAAGRQGVEVKPLQTKYPQGGEKQLITALTGREVPAGGLPMDVHVVVLNVGTAAAIADAVVLGRPLISRMTTVTGAVREPANLLLRIGTSFQDAINACGGYSEEPGKIFAGGSMTGICAPHDEVSVTKANNGIVVLTQKEAALPLEGPCIRCGRCVRACPAWLNPFRLKDLADHDQLVQAKAEHAMDCIVCGACSYVCPAKRWLAASIKNAKDSIAARRI